MNQSETNSSRREFLRTGAAAGLWTLTTPLAANETTDVSYSLGCYTRPWDKHDYRVALDGIAEAGFRYAGLMTAKGKSWVMITVDSTPDEVVAIAEEVKQRDLETLSIYGGNFPVARSVKAGIAGLKTLIDHCVICDCPNLLLGGTGNAQLVNDYYQVVAECCDYAADQGVGLSVKPHGGKNATGAECRKIIQQVSHPNFRIWYDPGNIYFYSEGQRDPLTDCPDVDGLVVGMSIKDYLPPKNVMVTPGQGQVRFEPLITRLREGGFTQGPVLVECLKPGTLTELLVEAQQARAFLRTLLESIA